MTNGGCLNLTVAHSIHVVGYPTVPHEEVQVLSVKYNSEIVLQCDYYGIMHDGHIEVPEITTL